MRGSTFKPGLNLRTSMCVVAALAVSMWPASGTLGQSPSPSSDPCLQAGLAGTLIAAAPAGSSVVETRQYSGQEWNDLFTLGTASEQLGAEALRAYAARLGQPLGDLCIVSVILIDSSGAFSEVKAVSSGTATTALLDGAPAIFGATPGALVTTTLPGTTIPTISWIDALGQPFQAIEVAGAVWIARQGDPMLLNLAVAADSPTAPPA